MQRMLRNCRQPPAACVGDASCSGRVAPVAGIALHLTSRIQRRTIKGPGRKHILEPCRITNTSKELFDSKEAREMGMEKDDGEENYMDLPDYQVFEPEKGPFEKRIQRTLGEALKNDKVDLRDTEYWFSNPEGNWNSKYKRLWFPKEEEEPCTPKPYHDPEEEEDAEERIRYSELDEGRVYLGMVTDVWLYHGVQIDIGAEFDGLVPCSENLWELAVDNLDVGEVVMVEIHKMRTPGLYRWPIQLKFCVRGLQDLMTPPDEYMATVDHGWAYHNGWSVEEVSAATGRTLETPTYIIPPDGQIQAETIQDGYGTGDMYWREGKSAPIEDYIDDPVDDPSQEAWLGHGAEEVEAAAWNVPSGF